MSDALIQIVDEHDQPIGVAQMRDAQERGLYHRIARVMIEDAEGNILLQKRASDMRMYPDCWDTSAAGHVDAGETNEAAAKRELFEEVGIKVENLEFLGSYPTNRTYKGLQLKRFNPTYRAIVDRNIAIKLESSEVSEFKWCSTSEIKDIIAQHPDSVTDGLADIINRFYS